MKKRSSIFRATVAAVVAVGAGIATTVASASGVKAYVPLGEANRVAVLDLETYRIDTTVDEVVNAHGAAMTADGRYVVAGSLTPAATREAPERPEGVSEADHEAHHGGDAGDAEQTSGRLYLIDTEQRRVVRHYSAPGPIHHVEITDDTDYAISTHPMGGGISVISLETGKAIAAFATGAAPNYAVESSDGRTVYVSNGGNGTISEIDTDEWYVRRNIRVGGAPEHIVLDEQRGRLYANDVSGGRTVAIDLASGDTVAEYEVGPAPHGLALGVDAATLYATSKDDDRLVAINLDEGTVSRAELGPAPYHVAVNPVDGQLLVTSRQEPRMWVVDPRTLEPSKTVRLDGIGHQIAFAGR